MVKYKFLPVDRITSYFIEDLSDNVVNQRLSELDQNNTVPFTIEEGDGSFYLMHGFYFFDALHATNDKRLIPCQVSPSTSKNETERLLKILHHRLDAGPSNWRMICHLIDLLTEHNMDRYAIANQLNKNSAEITRYIFHHDVPDHYKQQAIETNTTDLVNEIAIHPTIPSNHRNQYYQLAINGQFTYKQLYLSLSSYYMSYDGMYVLPFALFRIVF